MPVTDRVRLPARLVWTRFGVTDRTLDRWLIDPKLAFPRPILIRGRRYFFLDEIEQWERGQARGTVRSVEIAGAA